MGGSTNNEGRVEVCTNGRWGTICNNGQVGLAGAVCSQLGFSAEGTKPLCTSCLWREEVQGVLI